MHNHEARLVAKQRYWVNEDERPSPARLLHDANVEHLAGEANVINDYTRTKNLDEAVSAVRSR